MSFLIVGSSKGTFDENELISHLEKYGIENVKDVILNVIKNRKAICGQFKILSLN